MTAAPLTQTQRAVTHQVASLLLSYPDEKLVQRLPLLAEVVGDIPDAGVPLTMAITQLSGVSLSKLTSEYTDTFDFDRRRCLYLTYYTYGDTRKRGGALLRFTHAYRTAGMSLDSGELPDFLPVVLEFCATGDAQAGSRLLREHRAGLELLHDALAEYGSSYRHVLDAVRRTLPPPSARDLATALRLRTEGPPQEEVGMEPFALDAAMEGRR